MHHVTAPYFNGFTHSLVTKYTSLITVYVWFSAMLCHYIEGSQPCGGVNVYNSSGGHSCYHLQFFFENYDFQWFRVVMGHVGYG